MLITLLFVTLILIICLSAGFGEKLEKNFNHSITYGIIGVLTIILGVCIIMDNGLYKLSVSLATVEGNAKVQALKEEAVKNNVATFKATPTGNVVFEWVKTNPGK